MKNNQYICNNCKTYSSKWQGQCYHCNEWNTFSEVIISSKKNCTYYDNLVLDKNKIKKLNEISIDNNSRIFSHFKEFNRVMGNGIVKGSVSLIGGNPGIGKSSIVLQMMTMLSLKYHVLYVAGEESLEQIALRAKRMKLKNHKLLMMNEINVEIICKYIKETKPEIVVIDSIQTMMIKSIPYLAGGIVQLRESTQVLTQTAKNINVSLFLIGHVTKSGDLSGPRILEHIVDVVLFIEGEKNSNYRIIRALKNRFGPVNELGIFTMTDKGMSEVNNPSSIFLNRDENNIHGSVMISLWKGTRPILSEIQALVNKTSYTQPRRLAIGLDFNRLDMLLAILQRHIEINLSSFDIFINVVGGIRVNETSIDLAIIVVILSSFYTHPISKNWIILGEVCLSGEIRPIPYTYECLYEAEKHGFTHSIIPKTTILSSKQKLNMKIMSISNLKELHELLFI